MPDPFHADRAERDARDDALLEAIADAGVERPGADLTDKETRTIELLAAGLSREQIATELRVSPTTVRERVDRARYKLGAKNALHTCCEAIRRGCIS